MQRNLILRNNEGATGTQFAFELPQSMTGASFKRMKRSKANLIVQAKYLILRGYIQDIKLNKVSISKAVQQSIPDKSQRIYIYGVNTEAEKTTLICIIDKDGMSELIEILSHMTRSLPYDFFTQKGADGIRNFAVEAEPQTVTMPADLVKYTYEYREGDGDDYDTDEELTISA